MHASIKKSTLESLTALLAIDGARAWAVGLGLAEFVDRAEKSEELRAWVHAAIAKMMVDPAPIGTVAINIKAPMDLYIRFDRLFPEWGATSWIIRRILDSLVTLMLAENIDLEAMIERAIDLATTHEEP